ncbi:MAG: class I SAM-dependent methyltransferase [Steroidobacteraceae bacterium]
MNSSPADRSTDGDWEDWGRCDPYYAVLTDPRYRRSNLTEATKEEFFDSGRIHTSHVMSVIRRHVVADFAPKRVLDFGCGVGRTLIPLAEVALEVVGLDVSRSMLLEAQRNCDERGITNVQLLVCDDELSLLSGAFDLIHSYIVFQHIPIGRGRTIFSKLLRFLNPGGVGAIQLTYSKRQFASSFGIEPILPRSRRADQKRSEKGADPEMQMNPYNVNELLFLMQSQNIVQFHTEFVDHGGELGLFFFFQKP